MTSNKTPFVIHALANEGIHVVVAANTPFTAEATIVYPGDSIEITDEILALNKDRNGLTWLELTPESQIEKWGAQRFGIGPVPEYVREAAEQRHLDRLRAERDQLIRGNPALAKANASARRMADLDKLLGV